MYPSKHGKYTEQTCSRALRQRTYHCFIANRSPFYRKYKRKSILIWIIQPFHKEMDHLCFKYSFDVATLLSKTNIFHHKVEGLAFIALILIMEIE